MKALWAVAVVSLASAGGVTAKPITTDPVKAPAGDYALDPRHASLVVKIPHMGGFSRYTMRFNRLAGGFSYDPASWSATKVTIEVDAASVDTGDRAFDKTIAGYLGVAKQPKISFVGNTVTANPDGPGGKLAGDLTLNGVTRPVTLDVTFNGAGPGLLGLGTRMGFSGAGRINRTEFGVDAVRDVAGDDLDLIFDVEFVRK
jgi:polyisoprenoid-binding protein YceI